MDLSGQAFPSRWPGGAGLMGWNFVSGGYVGCGVICPPIAPIFNVMNVLPGQVEPIDGSLWPKNTSVEGTSLTKVIRRT